MGTNDASLPIIAEDLSEGVNFFGTLGEKFAEYLVEYGYNYRTAHQLMGLLGLAAHSTIQESLYPDDGEQFRREDGTIPVNEVPDASLIIRHNFSEIGNNFLQLKQHGEEVLDEIRPVDNGNRQGRFIISRGDNSFCAGVVIPCGFYDVYDDENDVMVIDGDGDTHSTYGEMADARGIFD